MPSLMVKLVLENRRVIEVGGGVLILFGLCVFGILRRGTIAGETILDEVLEAVLRLLIEVASGV